MFLNQIVVTLLLIFSVFWEIDAYGKLVNPVHRGGAWREGFDNPINYDDHANNCGGYGVYNLQNNNTCGPCGDNFAESQPRKNENGGYYGVGIVVKNYTVNQLIDIEVEFGANLKGYFELSICKLNKPDEVETESCFDAYPSLSLNGTDSKFYLPNSDGSLRVKFQTELPKDLTCERCVLRWHYRAGNNWGVCEDGSGKLGCGPQDLFRTCSDISISN